MARQDSLGIRGGRGRGEKGNQKICTLTALIGGQNLIKTIPAQCSATSPFTPPVPSAPSQPHPCPTASSPLPTGCCWVPTREEQPLSSATCLGMWTGTVTPRVCVLAQREIAPAKHQVPGQPCMGQEPANKACVKTQGV